MNAHAQVPVVAKFIEELRQIWEAKADIRSRMEAAKPVLEQLVKDDDLRVISATWPSTEGGRNLLLYVDPDPEDLHAIIKTVPTPLKDLGEAALCPGSAALGKLNASLR